MQRHSNGCLDDFEKSTEATVPWDRLNPTGGKLVWFSLFSSSALKFVLRFSVSGCLVIGANSWVWFALQCCMCDNLQNCD